MEYSLKKSVHSENLLHATALERFFCLCVVLFFSFFVVHRLFVLYDQFFFFWFFHKVYYIMSSPLPPSSPSDSGAVSQDSGFASISTINLYGEVTEERIVTSVLQHINNLGGGDLPPFISVTKLKPGCVYTVQKMVKRVQGEANAPYSGIQLYLDNCRTNLPSKYITILLFFTN